MTQRNRQRESPGKKAPFTEKETKPGMGPAADPDETRRLPTSMTLAPGDTLNGRYRIESRLGRGGMGEVWLAFDLKLKVQVALKWLRDDRFSDVETLELLRAEVRTARSVLSPNVCRIFDLVEVDGQELVSMEYIDGRTLSDLLRSEGPLDLYEARRIASQVLAGLEAIHEAGLVHRDIKPENVMITRTGRVAIMDFGIAKEVTQDPSATVSGTPAYMAPEVRRGEQPDGRADLFAAGIVLAEMLAPEGIANQTAREALWRGVRKIPPVLPQGPWQRVLARAVSSDRELRHPDAAAFSRALEEVTFRIEGAEAASPYPGLASFTEEDTKYFFGREAEVEDLCKRLQRSQLLAVIGPSGAGKSSFLQAGLVPALPEGWRHVICHPGSKPFAALAQALAPELVGDTKAIRALVRLDVAENALTVFRRWRGSHEEVLLVVDQFEELFTLNGAEEQAAFAELLGRLAIEADIHVLLSLRDDFLFHCHDHPHLSAIFADLTPLGPPTGSALRRALVQPALACGYRFEDETLVDAMLHELGVQRGSLPLLAFAVSRLWERRDRERGLLTLSAYEAIGGVRGALARHAEATLEQIGSRRLPIVREIFRNLVTSQGTRASMPISELLSIFDANRARSATLRADDDVEAAEAGKDMSPPDGRDAAIDVIRHLTDARLLTTFDAGFHDDEAKEHARSVEISHEILITAWPRFVRWRTQDADSAQVRDQVRQAAQVWEDRGRSNDYLWTGKAYREFQVWWDNYSSALTATEEAFATAMLRHAQRQRKRRRRMLASSFAVLLGVAIAVSALLVKEHKARVRAQASELLASARMVPVENASERLAYAIASLELVADPKVRRFALETLWSGPTARVLPSRPLTVDFDPTGKQLLMGGTQSHFLGWLANGSRRLFHVDSTFAPGLAWGYAAFTFDPDVFVGPWNPNDMRIRLFSWQQDAVVGEIPLDDRTLVGWSPNRRYWVTRTQVVSERGAFSLRVWDMENKSPTLLGDRLVQQAGSELSPNAFFWGGGSITASLDGVDSQGKWLVYAENRRLMRVGLAGMATETAATVGMHETPIYAVAIHPDGERVAAIDQGGEIRIWSCARPAAPPLWAVSVPESRYVVLRFDPSGRWLAASAVEGVARVWDLEAIGGDPQVLQLGDSRSNRPQLQGLAFSPDGRWIATSGVSALWPLSPRFPQKLRGHTAAVTSLAFARDGGLLASASDDGAVRLWSLQPGVHGRNRILAEGALNSPWQIQIDPSNRFLFVTDHDAGKLFDMKDGSMRRFDPEASLFATCVAISSDGRYVADGQYDLEKQRYGNIRISDLKASNTWSLRMEGGEPGQIAFKPDGSLLVAYQDDRLFSWDIHSRVATMLRDDVTEFAVSADGRFLLAAHEGRAALHDLAEGTKRQLESHGPEVEHVAIDPRANFVVTSDRSNAIRVGPANGAQPHTLLGHKSEVVCLAIDPDGRWIASSEADDSRVWLWPVPEGRPIDAASANEFLETLRSLTNLRVVQDRESTNGYRIEPAPFSGWEAVPAW